MSGLGLRLGLKWHKEAFSRVRRRIMASVMVRLNLGFRDRDGVYG